jgi:restriction endonuclease S subunit
MFVFMELKKIHISDIGKVVTGKTPRTSVAENYGGDIPFLTPSDNLSHKSAPKTTKTLTEQGLNEVKNCLLPSRSVCVSCIGSDLGKVVMTIEPTVTNQQFNSIIPNKNFNADFVYYLMILVGRELNYLSKTSTAVPIINKSSFSNYEVEVPDLETQEKISSFLSSFDAKIELNRRLNDNLEQQAMTIFDSMFPNSSMGEKCIGDTITPKRGKSLLSKNAVNGSVPVIAGGLEPATYHNVSNTVAPVLAISSSGANAGYVSLWNIPIWSSDSSYIDSVMTDDVYFWYVLLKKRQKEIFDAQTGSAQPHIYPQHIASMQMIDLDINEVNKYTIIVTPIFEKIGQNKDENLRLAALRDTLLPKLMSGEFDISNIDL